MRAVRWAQLMSCFSLVQVEAYIQLSYVVIRFLLFHLYLAALLAQKKILSAGSAETIVWSSRVVFLCLFRLFQLIALPADPSRVGLPKWKYPNMAARAAIHLCGKYEVGDLLGEGAIHRLNGFTGNWLNLNAPRWPGSAPLMLKRGI